MERSPFFFFNKNLKGCGLDFELLIFFGLSYASVSDKKLIPRSNLKKKMVKMVCVIVYEQWTIVGVLYTLEFLINDLFVYSGHFVIQKGRGDIVSLFWNVLNKRTGRLLGA